MDEMVMERVASSKCNGWGHNAVNEMNDEVKEEEERMHGLINNDAI
jgi:hypothetical protein